MEQNSYLIFVLHTARCAVDVRVVQEVISLPELTRLPESPFYVAGVLNLRGTLVPVVDLELCLGSAPHPYTLADYALILRVDGDLLGIIANQVYEPQRIAQEETEVMRGFVETIEGASLPRRESPITHGSKISLLDHHALVRFVAPALWMAKLKGVKISDLDSPDAPEHVVGEDAIRFFCPEANPEQRGIFRQRSRGLRRPIGGPDSTDLVPLAVFRLDEEYFGIDPRMVREISAVTPITPVPCCPSHIAGLMNLRGEIVTLVDIRSALKKPVASPRTARKIMVVLVDDHLAGVLADEVYEIVYLDPADLQTEFVERDSERQEYIHGIAPFGEKKLTYLDLSKILSCEELMVNEEA